jgi:hypothetical protein
MTLINKKKRVALRLMGIEIMCQNCEHWQHRASPPSEKKMGWCQRRSAFKECIHGVLCRYFSPYLEEGAP